MSRRYSTIIRTLACEADQAARAKAKQQADIVLQDLRRINIQTLDSRARREHIHKLFEYTAPGSSEYLNRQLDERLNDLANILSISLSTNPLINVPFLKRPEPTGVAVGEVVEHNRQIDKFAEALREGDVDAISDYFELVLQCSIYPDGFHKNPQIAYAKESKQLVVDYQLPTVDEVIPEVERYKHIRATGGTTEIKKK
jgi:hypothetical protein